MIGINGRTKAMAGAIADAGGVVRTIGFVSVVALFIAAAALLIAVKVAVSR